jgi:ABC-type lipoprotein release transport system permease subunit
VYVLGALTVVFASLVAMYPPVRRAGTCDPSSALRGV